MNPRNVMPIGSALGMLQSQGHVPPVDLPEVESAFIGRDPFDQGECFIVTVVDGLWDDEVPCHPEIVTSVLSGMISHDDLVKRVSRVLAAPLN